jgi:hypothetical protein
LENKFEKYEFGVKVIIAVIAGLTAIINMIIAK